MSADRMPSRAANALGGLRAAANMTPEQRTARAQKAQAAGKQKRDAEREAAGLPPRTKRPPEPSAEALEPYLEEVDRRWPAREWPNREARRRQAIILLRMEAAEAITEAFKRQDGAR